MNNCQFANIRPLAAADNWALAHLLASANAEYTRYFDPFAFDAAAIESVTTKAILDQWFAVEITHAGTARLVGFYMLRGMDEGFADPMYGVFIAEASAGRGLARLTLAHAETQCRLNGWKNLRLKVDPENKRAHALYLSAGFAFEKVDPHNSHRVVLVRQISLPVAGREK